MSHGDDLRTYYVVLNCSSLISAPDTNLNLVEFDWNSVDSVWSPINLSLHYTATFGCKKNALEDVSAASLALHAQNLQVQQRRMLYLSLPIDWVWHGIRYAKGFL